MCFVRARQDHGRPTSEHLGEAMKEFLSCRGVACGRCGKANLEVFYTSTASGRHLCPDCFQLRQNQRLHRAE